MQIFEPTWHLIIYRKPASDSGIIHSLSLQSNGSQPEASLSLKGHLPISRDDFDYLSFRVFNCLTVLLLDTLMLLNVLQYQDHFPSVRN